MTRELEYQNMDIPEYSNVVNNSQISGYDDANTVESTQHSLVQSLPTSSQHYDEQPPTLDFSAPPPYEDNNTDFVRLPPTYEEVLIETALEEAMLECSPILSGRFVRRPPSIGPLPQEDIPEYSNVVNNSQISGYDDENTVESTQHSLVQSLPTSSQMTAETSPAHTLDEAPNSHPIITYLLVALLLPGLGILFSVRFCSNRETRCETLPGFEPATIYFSRIKCVALIPDSSSEKNCIWIWLTLLAYAIFIFIYAIKTFLNVRRN